MVNREVLGNKFVLFARFGKAEKRSDHIPSNSMP